MSIPDLTDSELDELRSLIATRQKPRRGRPPGGIGSVNFEYKYECSVCHKDVGRDHLIFREVSFKRLDNCKTIRTRRAGWVCDTCIEDDPVFNSPKQKPGRHA